MGTHQNLYVYMHPYLYSLTLSSALMLQPTVTRRRCQSSEKGWLQEQASKVGKADSIGALHATLCLIIMGTPYEKLEVLKLLRMVEAHSTYQYAGMSSL